MQIVLTPHPKNAKKHPDSQVKQIAESIKRFEWQQPIRVSDDLVIVVGHGRWEAWRKYGQEMELLEPWVINNEGETIAGAPGKKLTGKELDAYRLADNKLNESEWDMGLAVESLKDIDDPALQELTGFDMDLLLEPDEKDDEAPEIPEEPKSKAGDLYILGNHRVYCGSATELEDMKKLTGEQKVDMWLTDPPYNVDYTGGTKDALKIENDNMDDASFREFLVDSYKTANEVMKPGAVFYIWHADSEGYNFRGAAHDIGWTIRQCLIWNKNSHVMGRQDYHWKHEPCLYGWKDGTHLWNSDRTQSTVLNFDKPQRNGEHPTMKPVELMAYQITNNTKEEDIVLDSFAGSGSTLIAAEKTGRICHAMEMDPRYIDVIVQRYVNYTGNTSIKKNGEDVQWEVSEVPEKEPALSE